MKHPLSQYLIAVAVVWIVILCVAWFTGGEQRFKPLAMVFGGFVIGMVAMYIAMHVYSWK